MSRAADVAAQIRRHGLQTAAPLLVTPGSEQVRATIERDGQMHALTEIGATVLANACGPCIGQWRRATEAAAAPNTIVTSYNRNFPRRNDGQPTTMNFIASPELVTALAAAGRLSFNPLTDTLTGADGTAFRLEPPQPAPEVPARRFHARQQRLCRAAGGRHARSTLEIDPHSERLQRAGAVARLGWPGFRRHAGAAEGEGQDDDRPHLAGRPLAALSRTSRPVQRQHVHGRDQCVHRRDRPGAQRA